MKATDANASREQDPAWEPDSPEIIGKRIHIAVDEPGDTTANDEVVGWGNVDELQTENFTVEATEDWIHEGGRPYVFNQINTKSPDKNGRQPVHKSTQSPRRY